MAMLLDQFLLSKVTVFWGEEQGVHVTRNAGQEELKLLLSLICPQFFVPAFGEGRHIIHHSKLARDWGMPRESIFPLQNGQILTIENGSASVKGRVEFQAVLINRHKGELVTTFTVNERRAMSQEGLVTVSLIISADGKLLSGPKFDCGAASFRNSEQWQKACLQMSDNILAAIKESAKEQKAAQLDQVALRTIVREIANKTLRAKLQTKPVLQIVIQQLTTSHPQCE
jgi:ribonuclease J